jgi:carbon storage regulator
MLVLTRKVSESITVSDNIRITVLCVSGNRVRLGIEAPRNLNIAREELLGSGDSLPAIEEPSVPHSTNGAGADREALTAGSRSEPRRGRGTQLPRFSGAPLRGWSRRSPRRSGFRRRHPRDP